MVTRRTGKRDLPGWLEQVEADDQPELRAAPIRPNVVDVTDREIDEALGRSFLADLPAELAGRLREEGERADYPAGTTVYRSGGDPQAALVIRG
jgi:hypothetical protein